MEESLIVDPERLNLDLNINRLEALFDAIDTINKDKINLTNLKEEFKTSKTENNIKDLKIKEYLNTINKLESRLENKNKELENFSNKNYALSDELKLDKLQISFLQKEMEERLSVANDNEEILGEYTMQLERSKDY